MSDSSWIILISFLVAANAGLLGCFLILRRQAMIGDAISHAVLPGIVVAFMVSNTTHPLVLLLGAFFSGLLAILCVGFLEKKIGIAPDVAIGIVFTLFFAVGIILVTIYTKKADLDQDCVLYGHPEFIPFDRWYYRGQDMGPTAFYILSFLGLCTAAFVAICYPALVLTSFDRTFSHILGIKTVLWHAMLMFLTALVTVASFKIVGAVLVIAFLVVPPATAYLMTHSLKQMLAYTILIDGIVAYFGVQLAYRFNTSSSGAIATVAGMLFALVFLGQSLVNHLSSARQQKKGERTKVY